MTEKRQKQGRLSPPGWVWGFLRPYKVAVAAALVALSVAAGTVLLMGRGLQMLIDNGFTENNTLLLNQALLALMVMIVVLSLASYARSFLVAWIGERLVADLRTRLYTHVVRLDTAFFELNKTGGIISRLTADTAVLQNVVTTSVSIALRNMLMMLGGLVMLFITSPKLTGLVLLVIPVVVGPVILIGRRVRARSKDSQERVGDVSAFTDETLHAARIVQAFGQEDFVSRQFSDHVERAFGTAVKYMHARSVLSSVVIFIVFAAVGVVLWIGGHDVLAGRLTAGQLSAFVFYAVLVAAGVGALSEVFGSLQRAAGASDRLHELLQTEPQIAASQNPVKLQHPVKGQITFEDVSFVYPLRPETSALDKLSFEIMPGETVAIVGPSGAGKTTIFQLLLRFYDATAGCVRLDGQDIRKLDPQVLRQCFAFVPQEPVVFSASVTDNIRFGRQAATEAEVRQAAQSAQALDFVEALPQGFDTPLGERGNRLSGGQRQRIALARAMLRDAPVLLLDEATSALDSESEQAVQQGLTTLMSNRTTLIIAHRLSTVQNADRILVLDHGQIVESGTHTDLMQNSALYNRLATLQFEKQAA